MEKSAGQARIFDDNERAIFSKSIVKQGTAGWHGVPAEHTHVRTCDLELPRGHATVKCGTQLHSHFQTDDANHTGKYFEVRYFLNVVVCSTHTLVYGLRTTYIHTNLVQKIGHCSVTDCSHSYG